MGLYAGSINEGIRKSPEILIGRPLGNVHLEDGDSDGKKSLSRTLQKSVVRAVGGSNMRFGEL
jgi:hypothetical protein